MFVSFYSLCISNLLFVIVESDLSIGLLKKTGNSPKPNGYGNRPRGVPFSRGPFYTTGEVFACIDNSKAIPFSQVNDNYCDCQDGSDEPGTSACPNGKFHCLNRGFLAEDIPSSRVNDQICDCCDGSDEWDGAVDCPNVCHELGAKYQENLRQKIELAKRGFIKRMALVSAGQELKTEKLKQLETLRIDFENMKKLKAEAQKKLDEMVHLESEARKKHEETWEEEKKKLKRNYAQVLFDALDLNKDGKITLEELRSFRVFDTNNDNIISDDEIKYVLPDEKEECDFEVFFESVYDNVHHHFEKSKENEKNEEENIDLSPSSSPVETVVTDSPDNDALKQVLEEKSETVDDLSKNIPVIPNLDLDRPVFDAETERIIKEADDARKEYEDVDKRYMDLDSSIKDSEQYTKDDFGDDLAWATLKGRCFELEENEYLYKLCLFDKATQKSKNSHIETDLGQWSGWTGTELNKFEFQVYQKGTPCWNGPDRSTKVVVECGEETELVEASEPSKCEYLFTLRSPAACPDPANITDEHEEL
ncbi:unnamed protein product [Thelazia callipaeda]|uniref:Glucosidase 2 subunit beta n=1 Tax=Thelazia callipaeda TaxID=103827 RepID=A0A0N5CW80_THECL|nr:unnamed protein product [Thelazia callipaeda]